MAPNTMVLVFTTYEFGCPASGSGSATPKRAWRDVHYMDIRNARKCITPDMRPCRKRIGSLASQGLDYHLYHTRVPQKPFQVYLEVVIASSIGRSCDVGWQTMRSSSVPVGLGMWHASSKSLWIERRWPTPLAHLRFAL